MHRTGSSAIAELLVPNNHTQFVSDFKISHAVHTHMQPFLWRFVPPINQSKRIYIAPYVAGESEARVGLG